MSPAQPLSCAGWNIHIQACPEIQYWIARLRSYKCWLPRIMILLVQIILPGDIKLHSFQFFAYCYWLPSGYIGDTKNVSTNIKIILRRLCLPRWFIWKVTDHIR